MVISKSLGIFPSIIIIHTYTYYVHSLLDLLIGWLPAIMTVCPKKTYPSHINNSIYYTNCFYIPEQQNYNMLG